MESYSLFYKNANVFFEQRKKTKMQAKACYNMAAEFADCSDNADYTVNYKQQTLSND